MILPLRRRHRHTFITLGVFLPIAFTVGIAARKPVPNMTALPNELAPLRARFETIEWERTDLFTKTPMRVRLLRETSSKNRFAVELSAAKDFLKPDLIVYWVAGNPEITGTLPDNAQLLGAFHSSVAMALPPGAETGGAALVLYSLADQEIVETSQPFTLRKP